MCHADQRNDRICAESRKAMIIRPWKKEDIASLVKIEQLCFSDPFSVEILESEFQNPLCVYLVLEENEEILGYGGYCAVLDEADIMTIGVLPKEQGKGFGRKLLDELLRVAKEQNVHSVWLEVRVSNEPAISLYKSFGFQEMGRRKGYYQDNGEDALTMLKEI